MNQPLGWVSFKERTSEQHVAHAEIMRRMPHFCMSGPEQNLDVNRVNLYEVWNAPQTVTALGYAFPRIHQLTGSCVGAGGGNAVFTLSALEVIRLNDPSQIVVPFWLYTYGKSRQRAGMRGRGEGSSGSGFAEAIRLDGIVSTKEDGLPSFQNSDGLTWSSNDEYQWSDGSSIPSKWNDLAKTHLVKTTAPCNSADEVATAIKNGYPCTDAYDYFIGNPRVQGDVLVGHPDSYGGHQTSILAWWKHPSLGELFLYQNQWQKSAYPKDPAGGPDCSCWITKASMDTICRNGEVFAFSQFLGFPTQKLSWAI